MATFETTLPTHVEVAMAEHDDHWPALDSSASKVRNSRSEHEWEMIPPPAVGAVRFQSVGSIETSKKNPRVLKHCQSSPNLLHYQVVLEEEDEESAEESSAVMIEDSYSLASSSMVMVSGPASVATTTSRVSFRDAILAQSDSPNGKYSKPGTNDAYHPNQKTKIRKVKPKFVVTPIKRCAKSTGDLQKLVMDEDSCEILGETDAHEYYSRKAHGFTTRKNGMKIRPDEAKRLEMTMNKKNMQRANQSGK